jgi:hypothetical protein
MQGDASNGTNGNGVKPHTARKKAYGRITGEHYDAYLNHRLNGKSVKAASKAIGFSHTTVYEYEERNPSEADRYKKQVKKVAIEAIIAAFPKSWQSAMTYLERVYPKEFALRTVNRTEISGSVDHNVTMIPESRLLEFHARAKKIAEEAPRVSLN